MWFLREIYMENLLNLEYLKTENLQPYVEW